MPIFEISSPDQSYASLQVVASDPSAVLYAVQRHHLHVADVMRDGEYVYSVRLNENGLWHIFQRETPPITEPIPEFG